MRFKKYLISLFAFITLASASQISAAAVKHNSYVLRDGRLVDRRYVATESLEWHLTAAQYAFNKCCWDEAVRQFSIVVNNFRGDPGTEDAYYYMGIAYFQMKEFDFANDAFSDYLKCQSQPVFFEDAVQYKFCIAEELRCGAKCRFFNLRNIPKWADGKELALTIYDEVIAGLPSHELAAKALYSKGYLLCCMKEYRDSVEAFRLLVRRFPKSELAPDAYLAITDVYLLQSEREFQNPDLLALAEINVRRFQEEFPREERLCIAENNVLAIKELYAKGLYDMGLFYERVGEPGAAVIYYRNAIERFPETSIVRYCERRLKFIGCIDV